MTLPLGQARELLSTSQRAALHFADRIARSRESDDRDPLARVLRQSTCKRETLENALDSVRTRARVVVHFHPDRYGTMPVTIAEALLADGLYRNQFETGISSGSRTAFAGGARDRWEQELFGGAYQHEGVLPSERPKDGVLELIRYPDGPLPRFGSCYFVLRPAASRLRRELVGSRPDARTSTPGRVLDSGIEAHIHGAIDLHNDVELLVIDPAFDDTGTSRILSEVCSKYGIPRERHCGFRMSVEDVPDDFRGPRMKALADRIADNGMMDAAVIGAAEASLSWRPQEWEDWGSGEETLQHLKQLWHVLVHYGAPARTYAG